MNYLIRFTDDATSDIQRLKRGEPKAYKKVIKLLEELRQHPYSGTGHVERMKYYQEATWSRRISGKHRLVYRVYEEVVLVLVLSAYGHYGDK